MFYENKKIGSNLAAVTLRGAQEHLSDSVSRTYINVLQTGADIQLIEMKQCQFPSFSKFSVTALLLSQMFQ